VVAGGARFSMRGVTGKPNQADRNRREARRRPEDFHPSRIRRPHLSAWAILVSWSKKAAAPIDAEKASARGREDGRGAVSICRLRDQTVADAETWAGIGG